MLNWRMRICAAIMNGGIRLSEFVAKWVLALDVPPIPKAIVVEPPNNTVAAPGNPVGEHMGYLAPSNTGDYFVTPAPIVAGTLNMSVWCISGPGLAPGSIFLADNEGYAQSMRESFQLAYDAGKNATC